jgi:predicted transcriptional regulator
MPRMKKPASTKLNDSINVPVTKPLKRRVNALAAKLVMPPTRYARKLIEEGVEREEATAAATN